MQHVRYARRPFAGVVKSLPLAAQAAEIAVRVAHNATLSIQRYVSG